MDESNRKEYPMFTGLLKYFPDALAEVAHTSHVGNQQHNPGQPLRWEKELSKDHEDALVRHLIASGTIDTDGVRHSAKVAWRALAMLQVEIDNERSQNENSINYASKEGEYTVGRLSQEDCTHTSFLRNSKKHDEILAQQVKNYFENL